jgi:PelA/Pel-15E family pectate lyase
MLVLLVPALAAAQTVEWRSVLDQPADWYRTSAAVAVADRVLSWQRTDGGWPKDIDMAVRAAGTRRPSRSDSTIDNGATVTQIRLLDRVFAATGTARFTQAAIRGIHYLFAAQYPTGGWPQSFPLRDDYSRHITFNDDAMTGVLTLLEDVATGRVVSSADQASRRRAAEAVHRATNMILRAQVRVGGRLTAWCAQHDAVTLEPRPARAYEHVSLSGRESVEIVRFLMRRPPTPDIIAAVDAAVGWLRSVRAADGTWARFYEIGTNRPIFSGRDGIVRYDVREIERERQTGYAWTGTWPTRLIDVEYPRWRARITASGAR